MWRSRHAVIALLLATCACSTTSSAPTTSVASTTSSTAPSEQLPGTTSTNPTPTAVWAEPGLAFLRTLEEVVADGDTEAAVAFYHPDAGVAVATTGRVAHGWRQISGLLETAEILEGPDIVMISDWGAVTLAPGSPECAEPLCPAAWANVFVIQDGAIARQAIAPSIGTDDATTLELFRASEEAYNAHDVDRLLSFYSQADFAPPLPREQLAATFEMFPDVTSQLLTLRELDVADSDQPAVFDLGLSGGSTRARTVLGVFHVQFDPDIDATAAILWDLWDDEILRENTLLDPNALDLLIERSGVESDPVAWFTTIEIPTPRTVTQTQVLEVGESTIELYNASDTLAELVLWAMRRFEVAGLPPPHVAAIYQESATSCLEGSAWAQTGGSDPFIRLCLDPEALTDNGDFTRIGAVTMLHELGHVWTAEYLDEDERLEFLTNRGLTAWNEPTVPWEARGSEHAAEILAWGLAEEPFELARVNGSDFATLAEAFRFLTGTDPINGW